MDELQDEQEKQYGTPEQPQPSTSKATADPAPDAAAASAANGSAQHNTSAAAAGDGGNITSASDQQQQEEVQQQDAVNSSKSASKPSAAADVDLDFEADEMSYWERQLLTASIALLQASAAVVKAFGKALLQVRLAADNTKGGQPKVACLCGCVEGFWQGSSSSVGVLVTGSTWAVPLFMLFRNGTECWVTGQVTIAAAPVAATGSCSSVWK